MVHVNVRSTGSLLPLLTDFPQVILRRLLPLSLFFFSTGPLPHENNLQGRLGSCTSKAERKENLQIWWWEAGLWNVKTLALQGVMKVHDGPMRTWRRETEADLKELEKHFLPNNWLSDVGNLSYLVEYLLWSVKASAKIHSLRVNAFIWTSYGSNNCDYLFSHYTCLNCFTLNVSNCYNWKFVLLW